MSSYPTYEEWKLPDNQSNASPKSCSYPTYEEWKQRTPYVSTLERRDSSYPTYEEWKQCLNT